ncbi:Aldo/keto reductase, partial [Dacryopinax primogenitus]
ELPDCQAVIDLWVGWGYTMLDCARVYGHGTSEEYLGQLDLKGCGVDTKAGFTIGQPGHHSASAIRQSVEVSLKALNGHKIRVLYLHLPDRGTPFEETLRKVDKLKKEGLIEEFGLSNHLSWEVAEYVTYAKANGLIQPTVYQGCYNAVERTIEYELIPCLRKPGIRFYAYSPLASGLLAGKILSVDDWTNAAGSRWDTKQTGWLAEMLKTRYAPLLPLLKPLKETLEKYNIRLSEAAQRWLQHHSALTPNDGVILGAGSLEQLEMNINDALTEIISTGEGGPLPGEVVSLLDEAWLKSKVHGVYYAH